MSSNIKLVCFDINSKYEEEDEEENEDSMPNQEENTEKSSLENPIRLFDEYFKSHSFIPSEKIKIKSSETKYSFSFTFPGEDEEIIYEIYVLDDLSFIHEICLNANGYLVFANIEKENTLQKIEQVVNYIVESCLSCEVKTYFVGLYKDTANPPSLNKESIEKFLEEKKYYFDYFEIKYENKEEDNHLCLHKERNQNDIIDEKYLNFANKNFGITETIEIVLKKIYDDVIKGLTEPNNQFHKNKFSNYSNYNENKDKSKCLIS